MTLEDCIQMVTQEGAHCRPEAGPPGGMVDVLSRWELSGGLWRVLDLREDWIDIGLFTCGGAEQVSRVSGARTSVLRDFLSGRTSSED